MTRSPARAASCLKRAYSASFCDNAVKNAVSFGWLALYCSRSSGVSTTAFKCETAPHDRPRRSVTSSSGSTTLSQVAGVFGSVTCCTTVVGLLQQQVDGRRDVGGLDRAEARQPGEVEEWVRVLFHVSSVEIWGRPGAALSCTSNFGYRALYGHVIGCRRSVGHRYSASRRRSAASTVLTSSIAMVIGPTPPGTGVISPATAFTPSKSTSPQRAVPSGAG